MEEKAEREACTEFAILKERLDRLLSAGVKSLNISEAGLSVTAYRVDADGNLLRDSRGGLVTFDSPVFPWLHDDPMTGPWYPTFAAFLARMDARIKDNPSQPEVGR